MICKLLNIELFWIVVRPLEHPDGLFLCAVVSVHDYRPLSAAEHAHQREQYELLAHRAGRHPRLQLDLLAGLRQEVVQSE